MTKNCIIAQPQVEGPWRPNLNIESQPFFWDSNLNKKAERTGWDQSQVTSPTKNQNKRHSPKAEKRKKINSFATPISSHQLSIVLFCFCIKERLSNLKHELYKCSNHREPEATSRNNPQNDNCWPSWQPKSCEKWASLGWRLNLWSWRLDMTDNERSLGQCYECSLLQYLQ